MPVKTINGLFDIIDGMDSYSFVMVLRHLAFVKNLKVDSLLFHVAVNKVVAGFHFAFALIDKNLQYFASVLVNKIVY